MSSLGTLVRIIVAGSEGKTSSAAWVAMDEIGGGGDGLSRQQRFELDCDYRRLLHATLAPRYWNALVAFYGIDNVERGACIKGLNRAVASHAHQHFKSYAIITWAEPKRAGAEGRRSTAILGADMYDMNIWDDNQGTPESTRRRWRAGIRKTLSEMLIEAERAALEILAEEELIERAA
ncbi:hypothetical protein [Pseudomonas sp.]|uniref:hypothetical protein n=1 Tax=Pseudomonas sp. TaxID=306 RepID=UPI001A0D2E27|nr:hypothetical protein [Pseudomonas sp.]MBF0675575.1 hypothetical protein [Pseudomonas sp.]